MTNAQSQFDVFLAHNSLDKPQVKMIAQKLKRRGLKPWLDEEQIPPGRPFQDEIQQAIPLAKSAAIFFGLQGLGSWQSWELRALITSCVKRKIPVIPILLPGVSSLPEHLVFLEQFRWISFTEGVGDENALEELVWGITGQKSTQLSNSTEKPGRVPTSDKLSSDRNVDYTRLRDLLAAGNWKDADYETYLVMLRVVGRKEGDWIRPEELLNFPCTDLRTIDCLWVKYSLGRFGFSVQKKIYLEVGGKPDGKYYEEAFAKFGVRVGWSSWRVNESWRRLNEIIFDTTAPWGHLPVSAFVVSEWRGGGVCVLSLFSHRDL